MEEDLRGCRERWLPASEKEPKRAGAAADKFPTVVLETAALNAMSSGPTAGKAVPVSPRQV